MVNTLKLLLLGSLITVTLSGCASSASPSASPSGAPADFSGTWMGGNAIGTKDMTLHLQQTGTTVTGTLEGVGAPDGPIKGSVGGNTIQLSAVRARFEPRLVIRGDLMDGTLDGVPLKLVRFGGPPPSSR